MSLFNYLIQFEEIQFLHKKLGNWQMVPLESKVNNLKTLFIKYEDEKLFKLLNDNITVNCKPTFLEIKKNNSYAYLCYLFIEIYSDNESFCSLHETSFYITDKKYLRDCIDIIGKNTFQLLIFSQNSCFLKKCQNSTETISSRKKNIEKLLNKSLTTKEKINFHECINILHNLYDNVEDLFNFLKNKTVMQLSIYCEE